MTSLQWRRIGAPLLLGRRREERLLLARHLFFESFFSFPFFSSMKVFFRFHHFIS